MKQLYLFTLFFIITGCQVDKKAHTFYVGTYTEGKSQGIYKYSLSKDGSLKQIGLVVKTNNPSFLAFSNNKKFLLAVNEIEDDNGNIESFLITKDTLISISKSSSGGAHPCFITTNTKNFVLTANYTGGNIGLLQLNKKGELTGLLDVQQHFGNDITERQQAPHAHSVWFEPDRNNIIAVDLGTNELWFSLLDTVSLKLKPANPGKLKMEPGAGPRHLTFHPDREWIYVLNELNSTITIIKKDNNNNYIQGESVSTLPHSFNDSNLCADIHISSDGKFVYASNRGHNSIAIYTVNPDNGSLSLVSHQSTHGEWPRNFSLSPDENYLLVANQYSQNIVSFKRNKKTGILKYITEIDVPTPVYILFYPD